MSTSSQKNSFERYTDPTGELSNHDLKLGGWFVRHKLLMRALFLTVFGIIGGGLFLYGVGNWAYYVVFGLADDRKLFEIAASEKIVRPQGAPAALDVSSPGIFRATAGKIDFVATVKNPNERHVAVVTYSFSYAGGQTDQKETVIMPNTERPIAVLGHAAVDVPLSASLSIDAITWKRVDPHDVFDVAGFTMDRTRFIIDAFSFTPQSVAANIPSNIITFDITNASAYSYWEVPLLIELMNGSTRVGIATARVERFMAGETRVVDVRSLSDNLSVTGVRVHPIIHLFDSRVYIAPEGLVE